MQNRDCTFNKTICDQMRVIEISLQKYHGVIIFISVCEALFVSITEMLSLPLCKVQEVYVPMKYRRHYFHRNRTHLLFQAIFSHEIKSSREATAFDYNSW